MKYFIIAFCLLLILLALFILFRFLKDSFKGKCCENCKGCNAANCQHRAGKNEK